MLEIPAGNMASTVPPRPQLTALTKQVQHQVCIGIRVCLTFKPQPHLGGYSLINPVSCKGLVWIYRVPL